MAARTFAALIDQDSVTLLEYRAESGGFRLLDTRHRVERFASAVHAAEAIVTMLGEMNAKRASLSVVLQHFGSFFHALVLPAAAPEHIVPIIKREVQRSFNVVDPVIAYSIGKPVDRPDAARSGLRQVYVAGAPRPVIEGIQARFERSRITVDTLTVAPEVFRRLYEALDGSQEVTALLVCLQNGPHIAFFVNARLELAIEPPLRLEGDAPFDPPVVVDQIERGAIFLRQQAQGAVATRLLLSAPPDQHDPLASTIEARTGMHVAPLGQGVGSPEAVVAMGAVLSGRGADRLDLYPRPPAFDERLKSAMSGPGLVMTTLMTAAMVAAFWAGMQILTVKREQRSLEEVQSRVERALPALAGARHSAETHERLVSIRNALRDAVVEKQAIAAIMNVVPTSLQPDTQLDSLSITRVAEGIRTKLFGHVTAPSGPAATSEAAIVYRRFKSESGLKNLAFESAFLPRNASAPSATRGLEALTFSISALSPVGGR